MMKLDSTVAKDALKAVIKGAGVSRAHAAQLLFIKIDTLNAWMKPAANKGSNPPPLWAIDLLARKTNQAPHPLIVEAETPDIKSE